MTRIIMCIVKETPDISYHTKSFMTEKFHRTKTINAMSITLTQLFKTKKEREL